MKRTISEIIMLLKEGGSLSIDAHNYSAAEMFTLISALSSSKGTLELRNCDKFHTSDLLMMVRYGNNNLKLVF